MFTVENLMADYKKNKPYLILSGRGLFMILLLALALYGLSFPFTLAALSSGPVQLPAKVKHPELTTKLMNILDYEGQRSNPILGPGLVVGLNGTGDKFNSSIFTKQSFVAMLERLGINADDPRLKSKNVAMVMVTASLPAFSRQGSKLDVSVSSMGDATSLIGGILLPTPLRGADSKVYALAQGPIITSSYTAKGDAASVTKGVPTSGRIINGAYIEEELPFVLSNERVLRFYLKNHDFTTAKRIVHVINTHFKGTVAQSLDAGTIQVNVPGHRRDVVNFISEIHQLTVTPNYPAKIVINESEGIVTMNREVKVQPAAVGLGSLVISIKENSYVSQPGPLGALEATIVPQTEISIDEGEDKKMALLNPGVDLRHVVRVMNAMGVTPREIISVLQALKKVGALEAEVEVM